MTKQPTGTRDVAVLERALIITTTALMLIAMPDGTGQTPEDIAADAFRKLNTLKNGGFG